MEVYLLISALIIFAIYSVYEGIRVFVFVSKCFTKETREEHNAPTRLKALFLPKSMWLGNLQGDHVPNLIKANEYWQLLFKRMLASIGVLFTAIFIIMLPSIYFVLTQ